MEKPIFQIRPIDTILLYHYKIFEFSTWGQVCKMLSSFPELLNPIYEMDNKLCSCAFIIAEKYKALNVDAGLTI